MIVLSLLLPTFSASLSKPGIKALAVLGKVLSEMKLAQAKEGSEKSRETEVEGRQRGICKNPDMHVWIMP